MYGDLYSGPLFFHQNVYVLRTKLDRVRQFVSNIECHVITFVESWLHTGINNAELDFYDYNIFGSIELLQMILQEVVRRLLPREILFVAEYI